jgi:hypothetical protein
MADINWLLVAAQWASSFGFWAVIIIILCVGSVGVLWWIRHQKLCYLAEEWIPLSPPGYQKAMQFESKYSTAGWFKEKKTFFNLFEVGGPLQMEIKDGRKIVNASSEDYVYINGKKGIRVMRKGDDPKILVPLSKVKIDNYELIQHIAPADYQDAASKFIDDKVLETMNSIEKWAGPIILGVTIVIFVICLILIIQFSNQRMDKAMEFYEKAMHISPGGSNAP